jgi:hypothetical protein
MQDSVVGWRQAFVELMVIWGSAVFVIPSLFLIYCDIKY